MHQSYHEVIERNCYLISVRRLILAIDKENDDDDDMCN